MKDTKEIFFVSFLNKDLMKNELENLTLELERISGEAQTTFGKFSEAQINWQPAAEMWSVGQCFEHLIKTNLLFLQELEIIAAGNRRNSWWENYSPLSGFFGRIIINELKADKRKIKAPAKIVPASSVAANIIEDFAAHQIETIAKIKTVKNVDWQKTKMTSPIMKLITYKLADGLQIVVEHEKRHFRQAEKVLQNENFPR